MARVTLLLFAAAREAAGTNRDTVDALAGYRSAHGLLSHDEAITTLLERASEDVS